MEKTELRPCTLHKVKAPDRIETKYQFLVTVLIVVFASTFYYPVLASNIFL